MHINDFNLQQCIYLYQHCNVEVDMQKHNFLFSFKQNNNYSETFYDLQYYLDNWLFYYNGELLQNCAFTTVQKNSNKHGGVVDILKIKCNNVIYDFTKLTVLIPCKLCSLNYVRKHQHIKIAMMMESICPKCNFSNSHKTETYKNKFKNTMLERYGVDHPMKHDGIKKKLEGYFIEKYGVNTPWKSKLVREKQVATMIKKYGKGSITDQSNTKNRKFSLIEELFVENLIQLYSEYNIKSCKNRQYFLCDGEKCHSIDIYFKNIKYAIEIDGDFWHGNIEIYDKNKYHPILKTKTFEDLYNETNESTEWILKQKQVIKLRRFWATDIEKDINKCLDIVKQDITELLEN